MKRLLGLSLGLLLLLVSALAAGVAALLWSGAGLRLALALAPAELGLRVETVEGSLAGGFRLGGVTLERAGLAIERVEGRLKPIALLAGILELKTLAIEGLSPLPGEADPAGLTASRWPFPLPEPPFAFPITLSLPAFSCRGEWAGERFALTGGLVLGRSGLTLDGVALEVAGLDLRLEGRLQGAPLALDLRFSIAGDPLPAPLSGALRGDLARLIGEATLALDSPLSLRLDAEGLSREDPQLRLTLTGRALDPPAWWPDGDLGPLSLAAELALTGRTLALRAEGEAGERRLALQAEGRLGEEALALDSLRLSLSPGLRLDAAGDLAWAGAAELSGNLALAAPPPLEATLEGAFELGGTLADLAFRFEGRVEAAGGRSELMLAGRAGPSRVALESLRLEHAAGGLRGGGSIDLEPPIRAVFTGDLRRLRLAALGLPLAAVISARLEANAELGVDAPRASLRIEGLAGEVAGQPLGGWLRAERVGDQGAAAAELALGAGRLSLSLTEDGGKLAGRLEARALKLPEGIGPLDAEAELNGVLPRPEWRLALRLAADEARGLAVRGLALKAWGRGASLAEAVLRADGLAVAGRSLGAFRAALAGERPWTLSAALSGQAGSLELALQLLQEGDAWEGRIERIALSLEPLSLNLAAPAPFAVDATGLRSLGPFCLEGGARLCLEARGGREGLRGQASLAGFPLESLTAGLPEPWPALAGALSAEAALEAASSLRLSLRFEPTAWPGQGPPPLQAFALAATLADGQVNAEGELSPSGRFSLAAAQGSRGWHGRAEAELELAPFEPWIPALSGLAGRLRARLEREEGGVDHLVLAAEGLSFELPAFGAAIALSELKAEGPLSGLGIAGAGRAGEGRFRLEGEADLLARQLRAHLHGEELALLDRPDLALVFSPDLRLRLSAEAGRLEGRLGIPRGRIDLSRLEAAEPRSRDVVVVGEAGPEPWPFHADLLVEVGPALRLQGFGLDARFSGVLALRERPDQAPAGFGALDAQGRFAAYGAALEIARGRVIFAGPLDAPVLDLRAERAIDGGPVVAVEARGEATAPALRLVSEPPLAEEEILAYLITGRSFGELRSGEGASLAEAAAALGTLGGDLLARRLGERLGLDLAITQASGGAATLTAGRKLSPRLFVGYGFALDGAGQHLILRYLLGGRWRAEVESGAVLRARLQVEGERRAP